MMYLFSRTSLNLLFVTLFSIAAFSSYSQSPKKYWENGMYEKAYVNAVYKQNKKVKLKPKLTDIIYKSYAKIYQVQGDIIRNNETNWEQSYNALLLTAAYRAKSRHQGVNANLKDMLLDTEILNRLGQKFNFDNEKDLTKAASNEINGDYSKAIDIYLIIGKRHNQALQITNFEDRIEMIDYTEKIEDCNRRIGDQYIQEAREILNSGSTKSSKDAIKLIEKARSYRPLSLEEESLLELANMMMSNTMIQDAEKLLATPTKKNARLAYELIEHVRNMRVLTSEEERLSEQAKDWGTTRILVSVDGNDPTNTSESLSGFLNKSKNSKWINYYFTKEQDLSFDFNMEVKENKPTVELGKTRREVRQESKNVEYYEDETDSLGNTTKVKKTRKAIALVAILSRTKTATLFWTITVKDLTDGKAVYSKTEETKVDYTNQFAKVESGDILALPDNIETDVDLDSQPFPSDQEMIKEVQDLYLNELNKAVKSQSFDSVNINRPIIK